MIRPSLAPLLAALVALPLGCDETTKSSPAAASSTATTASTAPTASAAATASAAPTKPALAKPSGKKLFERKWPNKLMAFHHGADGKMYVAGRFKEKLDLGGKTLEPAGGKWNSFIARVDAKGAFELVVQLKGPDTAVETLAVDASGAIAIGGHFDKTLPFDGGSLKGTHDRAHFTGFVAVLEPNGKHRWSHAIDVKMVNQVFEPYGSFQHIGFDSEGNVIAAGVSGQKQDRARVLKMSKDGKVVYDHELRVKNPFGWSKVGGLEVAKDGTATVGMTWFKALDFGRGERPKGGAALVRYDAAGKPTGDTPGAASFAAVEKGRVVAGWIEKGDSAPRFGQAIAKEGDRSFVMGLDASGKPRWHHAFPNATVKLASGVGGSRVAVATCNEPLDLPDGSKLEPGKGHCNSAIMRLDDAGKLVWKHLVEGTVKLGLGPAGETFFVAGHKPTEGTFGILAN